MKKIFTIIMVFMFGSVAFATHGTRMVGYNAKSMGRGGTSLGTFDSPSLMMTNPAGISFLNSSSMDVNFSLMIPRLYFSNSFNDAEGKINYFPLPGLAYVNYQNDNPLTWGVGVFTQGGMGADFTLTHPLFGSEKQEYHSKLAVMQGGPSIAYKISPELSVGASLHLVYGQMEFSMPYSLSPSVMKGVINPVNGMTFGDMFSAPPSAGGFGYTEVTAAAKMSDLTAFGFNGKLGLAYKVNEDVTLGLSYSSAISMTYKNGKAKMDMTAQLNDAFMKAVMGRMMGYGETQAQAIDSVMAQFSGMGIDLSKGVAAEYKLEAKLKVPQSIGFGVGYRAAKNLRLSADVEWVNWEKAYDNMSLSLSEGNNSNINRMLGNTGDFTLDFPMKWKNQICLSIGGEYDINTDLTVRAGYAYGNNPVPNKSVFPVFPAIVENHLTLGGSYKISQAIILSAAYELAINKKETASSQSIIAHEYDNSTSQLMENILHISLSWMLE